jgi:hypothetical protein
MFHRKPLAANLAAQVDIRSGSFNKERISATRAGGDIFFRHFFSMA